MRRAALAFASLGVLASASPSLAYRREAGQPLSAAQSLAVTARLGLAECKTLVKLSDVRREGYVIQSWRAPASCVHRWHQPLFDKYSLLDLAMSGTAEQITRSPWRCGEDGAHEAFCESLPKDGTYKLITIQRNAPEGYIRLIENVGPRPE